MRQEYYVTNCKGIPKSRRLLHGLNKLKPSVSLKKKRSDLKKQNDNVNDILSKNVKNVKKRNGDVNKYGSINET